MVPAEFVVLVKAFRAPSLSPQRWGVYETGGGLTRSSQQRAQTPRLVCASQRLSRASVQLGGDLVEARLIVPGQVRAFGEVMAQEPIAVLVRRALPRAARIADVDLQAGVEREADVLGHLLADRWQIGLF